MSKFPKGFSLQINAGQYGGFWVSFTKLSWRIALGWVAITLFFFDVEPVFHKAIQKAYADNKDTLERSGDVQNS